MDMVYTVDIPTATTDEATGIKTITIIDPKVELLKNMLNIIDIQCTDLDDIVGTIIIRDKLLSDSLEDKFISLQESTKNAGYSTGKLTSLHKNSNYTQKFPAINMLRQLLKCNGYWLRPKKESNGYTSSGSKIIKRYFVISHFDCLDDDADLNHIST
jgi:hypothetical protein